VSYALNRQQTVDFLYYYEYSRYSPPILIGKEGYGEGCAVDCRPHSFKQVYYDNLLYLCFATNIKIWS